MPAFWRLFKDLSKPLTTAEGLAIDDALPHAVEHNQSLPILHLYTFRPSAIVGKYQDDVGRFVCGALAGCDCRQHHREQERGCGVSHMTTFHGRRPSTKKAGVKRDRAGVTIPCAAVCWPDRLAER